MAITLGKDAVLNLGALGPVIGVTDVQWSGEARTIDVEAFGSRYAETYSTGISETLTFTVNDSHAAATIYTALNSGATVDVSGGVGGWTVPAVIVSVSESDPLDGVCTLTVTARRTRTGLKV